MNLYWSGDLMSLNSVLSTMASEPLILPNKNPHPYFPKKGCTMTVCTTLGFAPYSDPNSNSHLYLILRYYPLGLGLLSCRTALLSWTDLPLRLRFPAPHVTTPIIPPTSGKTRLYTTCTSWSFRSRHSSPQHLN